ncbi:ABC transporter substrate-binding protein [Vibrio sp. YMD68]|uniref:substrate-binding periplasmic protein n=1 Tax=Vibrio sp. YMD68 TaxID=3042300 RepID=UPI00249B1F01|nr:ABC transporter substrate-binding protein [Vibrio sp. YMD68]WGV98256.1 ABC transporter substrate-binding protein [Vibrio sp. YMD68]
MNTIRTYFVFFLCVWIAPFAVAGEEKVVRLASGDWFPYTSSQYQGGLLEKVVQHAFHSQGYDVKIDYMPWIRSAKLVEYAKYDGTFPWYSNNERRAKFIYPTIPLMHADTVMFYHKDVDFHWDTISDLSQYKIGGVAGFAATELLVKNGVETINSVDLDENILKLLRHRVDVVPIERQVGLTMVSSVAKADQVLIQIDEKPLISNPMYMMFSKNERGQKLSHIFDRGLTQIKDNGCYDQLMLGNPCE